MKIRIVKTASKAQAVQVVHYHNNKRVVLKHIGSANTDFQLQDLIHLGQQWIKDYSEQLSFFPDENPNQRNYSGLKLAKFCRETSIG
jgi:hypothetical protein